MNIILNVDSTDNSLDLIKYCTLYFDKLSIDVPISIDNVQQISKNSKREKPNTRIDFTRYISDSVNAARNVLIDEGICNDNVDSSFGKYDKLAKELVANNSHLFLSPDCYSIRGREMIIDRNAAVISEEAQQAINEIITLNERRRIQSVQPAFQDIGNVPDFYLALNLYWGLVNLMISHIENGDNVATNSSITNSILLKYYSSTKGKYINSGVKYNYAKIEAAKILLPYVRNAPLDDILEIRSRANEELQELRFYVEGTLNSFDKETLEKSSDEEINLKLQKVITPSIKRFERKLAQLKIATAREFIKNVGNPLSYAPMLTTFFSKIPASGALGFSAGMILIQTYLFKKEKELELKNDPLYFTIKI